MQVKLKTFSPQTVVVRVYGALLGLHVSLNLTYRHFNAIFFTHTHSRLLHASLINICWCLLLHMQISESKKKNKKQKNNWYSGDKTSTKLTDHKTIFCLFYSIFKMILSVFWLQFGIFSLFFFFSHNKMYDFLINKCQSVPVNDWQPKNLQFQNQQSEYQPLVIATSSGMWYKSKGSFRKLEKNPHNSTHCNSPNTHIL